MKKTLLLIFAIFSLSVINAQTDSDASPQTFRMASNEQMLAIQQMNYHTIAMSRIIQNQTLETLDYELSQLLNNLTIEHIVDLPEIKMFREKLMMSVQELQITAEERVILKRLQDLRQENLIWESMSGALNPAMIMTNASSSYQTAFYALLTAARGFVEYQSLAGQMEMEEIQALWELRKTDLGVIKDLRTEAFSSIYDLYRRFRFSENIRLTEQDAELYANILNEKNADKRLRRLQDNYDKFSHILDYDYFLGMTILDVNGYNEAKPYLRKYLQNYSNTPIFRRDEKSAYVYLAKLAYEKLTLTEIDDIINNSILKIIPNNGPALIQCVLKYLEIEMNEKAFNLIRRGLDNPYISCKSSIVMMSVELSSQIKQYPKIWDEIQTCVLQCEDLSIDSYLAFLACCPESIMFEELGSIFKIKDATKRKFLFFGRKQLKDTYTIDISRKYGIELNNISAYFENNGAKSTDIYQSEFSFGDGVYTKDELQKKVSAFKSAPMLLYNFFSPMGNSKYFRVKAGLDLNKNINHYNGAESVDSKSVRRLEKILKKDLKNEYYSMKCKTTGRLVEAYNFDSVFTANYYKQWNYIPVYGSVKNAITLVKRFKKTSVIEENFANREISFRGDSLMYIPFPVYKIEEKCIRIVLNDKFKTILTFVYDRDNGIVPFSLMSNGDIYYLLDTSNMDRMQTQETVSNVNETSTEKGNWFKRLWNKIFG